jgi:hypothetical protein
MYTCACVCARVRVSTCEHAKDVCVHVLRYVRVLAMSVCVYVHLRLNNF